MKAKKYDQQDETFSEGSVSEHTSNEKTTLEKNILPVPAARTTSVQS